LRTDKAVSFGAGAKTILDFLPTFERPNFFFFLLLGKKSYQDFLFLQHRLSWHSPRKQIISNMSEAMEVEKKEEAPKTLEEALQEEEIEPEILSSPVDDIVARTRGLDREIQILRHEQTRLQHELGTLKEKIKENNDKIKLNKQLPYLVANVVEVHTKAATNLSVTFF